MNLSENLASKNLLSRKVKRISTSDKCQEKSPEFIVAVADTVNQSSFRPSTSFVSTSFLHFFV